MKGRTVILDRAGGREAAALMVDGRLEDFLIRGDAPAPGTIYRARVDRPVKGQGGAFLVTPDGTAFLRRARGLPQGGTVLVQVSGHAEPGKAIPVTRRLLFKSRHAIVTPDAPGINVSRRIRDPEERERLLRIAAAVAGTEAGTETGTEAGTEAGADADAGDEGGCGIILRSSCAGAAEDEIARDIAGMLDRARRVLSAGGRDPARLAEGDGPHLLAWREWTEPAEIVTGAGGFAAHGVTEALEAALSPQEPLAGGAVMFVEPTRALVAVDVNTGGDASPAAGFKANLACARALPRALRIRGLGGQIVIDPAPMAKKDRRAFETALRAAFRADPEETAPAGWTPLGHFELNRKRGRVPLHEVLR